MRLAAILLALLLAGCATPSEELARVRAENELLKAELHVIKRNCSYYRQLEVRPDEEAEDGDGP
jgi:hypothetical protein